MNEQDKNAILGFYEIKDYESLVEYCTNLIASDPHDFYPFAARGTAYFEQNDESKAVKDFTRAIELNPTHLQSYLRRYDCYMNDGQFGLAIDDIQKAMGIGTDIDLWGDLGLCNYYLGKNLDAISYFSKHLEKVEDRYVLSCRSIAYFLEDNRANGFQDFVMILSKDRDDYNSIERIEKIIPETDIESTESDSILSPDVVIHNAGLLKYHASSQDLMCGIYVLEFENHEFYVGQTKNIEKRLIQHRQNYQDIKSVYFKTIALSDLLIEENRMISLLERNLVRVRNVKQIDFSNLFGNRHQKLWLVSPTYNHVSGIRYVNNDTRIGFHDRFVQLSGQVYFNKLIEHLSIYIETFIPNYLASEYNYWSITCFPKHLEKDLCISRINVNSVPILSVYYNDEKIRYMVYSSKYPFLISLDKGDEMSDMLFDISTLSIEFRDGFENSDRDEITMHFSEDDFHQIISNKKTNESIRRYNLRMMLLAGSGTAYRRKVSHCLDLADSIFCKIGQEMPNI